ncbi:MAG: excinuclease ABC subunit UvrC [Bacteroidales bacterium]|nr:excinuclease ABC subunit UvrC [Bacteroidales bacterium]
MPVETLKDKIALLPHAPGVYRYYDAAGTVIYVGKAKDLFKRVSQYFVDPARLTLKTRHLVAKIADIQYAVVDSEADALLLENNLIKQYKPRYNILLKDSKTYPWICVTAEPFPRVFLTRRVVKDGSRYFGPYSSVMHARVLMDFFRTNYPLRSCKHKIDAEDVLRRRIRPCLDIQIGRCRGCCNGGISTSEYGAMVEEIVHLLSGGVNDIVRGYRTAMKEAADQLDFERAQALKDRMDALQRHYAKSVITTSGDTEADVFSLVFDGSDAFGNFLRVRGGAIIQSLNLGFKLNIEEEREAVLSEFIAEIRAKFGALSRELIVPFLPDVAFDGLRVPLRGDKLALLELSTKNAKEFRFNALKSKERTNPQEYREGVLEELRVALGMRELPRHMECFDNSNILGTNPVAACVVFRDAEPSKRDYRKFKIKTVVGANDYASMKEIVNRRYARMLQEAPEDLPQLVVIDGGKGQLNFAWQALCELGIQDRLTVVGLAERMEEIIRVGDPYPLFLDRNSRAFKVITHIRDEAHRFGITFHRSLRSKSALQGALDTIKGVGPKTAESLLMHFGSVARIAAAPVDEIAALTGPVLAVRIHEALNHD